MFALDSLLLFEYGRFSWQHTTHHRMVCSYQFRRKRINRDNDFTQEIWNLCVVHVDELSVSHVFKQQIPTQTHGRKTNKTDMFCAAMELVVDVRSTQTVIMKTARSPNSIQLLWRHIVHFHCAADAMNAWRLTQDASAWILIVDRSVAKKTFKCLTMSEIFSAMLIGNNATVIYRS